MEPFSLVDLTVRSRRRDNLVWIDDSEVIEGFLGVRSDIEKVSTATYALELASLLMGEDQPDPDIFDLIVAALRELDRGPVNPVRFMLFEIRLLKLLGHGPRFDSCPECGEEFRPGEAAVFSPPMGGALHESCVKGADDQVKLSAETLALVNRGMTATEEVASRLRLGRHGVGELRSALSAFVRYVRGADINSLTFLEHTAEWAGASKETSIKTAR